VSYVYDGLGRLTEVTTSDGTMRSYAYDGRDQMIAVREPGRVVENQFDASGRLVHQVVTFPDSDDPYALSFSYVVEDGAVVQTDVLENDGSRTSYRFNTSHYVVSETYDADGPAPVALAYDLGATNIASAVTISCAGPMDRVTRTIPLPTALDEDTKGALVRAHCATHR
jgi:YD repeat-containing protein